jgi:hypothetical protein
MKLKVCGHAKGFTGDSETFGDFLKEKGMIPPWFSMTQGDDFDYLYVYGRYEAINTMDIDPKKVIVTDNEPTWSRNASCNWLKKKGFLLDPDDCRIITCPHILKNHDLNYFMDNDFTPQKTKKCSIVVSAKQGVEKNPFYEKRVQLVEKILDSDLPIDIYGKGWEDHNISDSRMKGFVDDKSDALIPYEYSIAIENCIEERYITEKFHDCILTDTKPIYCGWGFHMYHDLIYDRFNIDSPTVIEDLRSIINQPKRLKNTAYYPHAPVKFKPQKIIYYIYFNPLYVLIRNVMRK